MAPAQQPWFWLVAGPNGVGKSTYARQHLERAVGAVRFINMDELSRGIALRPEEAAPAAARIALRLFADFVHARRTFAIETTLAGRTHLMRVAEARAAGFKVGMLYFAVGDVITCIERVARRVKMGGHDVPEADIRRRFARSQTQFDTYRRRCDRWSLFNNEGAPWLAAEGQAQAVTFVDAAALAGVPEPLRRLT